jgi:hypothetical protein
MGWRAVGLLLVRTMEKPLSAVDPRKPHSSTQTKSAPVPEVRRIEALCGIESGALTAAVPMAAPREHNQPPARR